MVNKPDEHNCCDIRFLILCMNKSEIIVGLSKSLGVVTTTKDQAFSKQMLTDKINELLNSDFSKLISILYRIDISEAKLKQLLTENPNTDAGLIIADMMIERQLEKIKSRQQYKGDKNISDDEKW